MSRERITIAIPEGPTELREAIVDRARRRGFLAFLDGSPTPLPTREGEEWVRRVGNRLQLSANAGDQAAIVSVTTESDLAEAVRGVRDGGVLVIEWTGDRLIPLENAIAARGRRFRVWVFARGPSEVPGALGALEHGADRVFVPVRVPADIDLLEAIVEGPLPARLEWTRTRLVGVRPAGVGDRVIVDTTSLLRPEEGLLVGSAAAFLFHVASEAVGSEFSRARPFRVNAGSAHSYVLMSDATTRYLSELSPGDSLLICTPEGIVRSARVGRVKIERRPMVVLTAADRGHDRTVFLQEAETVRLSTVEGRSPTTSIAIGEVVHCVRLPEARHLGRAVEETIEER